MSPTAAQALQQPDTELKASWIGVPDLPSQLGPEIPPVGKVPWCSVTERVR